MKGPVLLLTEVVQNLRLDGLLTLITITHGNLGGLMDFTGYPEQMREKREEICYGEIHRLMDQNKGSETQLNPIPSTGE